MQGPPLKDISSGAVSEPDLTICKKYVDDWNYFCNCFDKNGNETIENIQDDAHYACCQCPEERRDGYTKFQVYLKF